jgi:hypothetical protein
VSRYAGSTGKPSCSQIEFATARRKAAALLPDGGVVSARSSALNAGCSRSAGRPKCSAVAISAAVVVPAPAYSIASAVEMLVCEKMKLSADSARSARCRSIPNARLSDANAAASSAVTVGR